MLSLLLSVLLQVSQTFASIHTPPPPILPVEVELISPPHGQIFVEDLWRIRLYSTLPSALSAYIFITIELAGTGMLMDATTGIFLLHSGKQVMGSSELSPITTEFYNSSFKTSVARMGGFPDGNYTITYYVYEAGGGLVGSSLLMQQVQNHSAPELQFPVDYCIVNEPLPVFSWFPSSPSEEISYTLRIVELLPDQSPESAIEANPAWFYEENIIGTDMLYPIYANYFEHGNTYAWQVEGIYGESSTGKSKVETFCYENPLAPPEEGSEIWRFETGGKVSCSPAIALDESLICGSDDGYIYSLDNRGGELWRLPAGSAVHTVAIGPSGNIYATSNSGILCVDPSGFLLWQNNTLGPVRACPVIISSQKLYVGAMSGLFYAIDNTTGDITNSLDTQKPIYLPASADSKETIYFASGNRCISVIENEEGLIENWSFRITSDFSGGPVIAEEYLYLAAGRKILRLGLDGVPSWIEALPSQVHAGPIVSSNGIVYAAAENGNIHTIRSSTSKRTGIIPAGSVVTSIPAIDVTGSLFLGCDDGYFRCFSPSGFNLWEFKTQGSIHSCPVIGIDGTVYFGSDDQCIYAVTGSGAGPMTDGWPQFCRNSSNNGFIQSACKEK